VWAANRKLHFNIYTTVFVSISKTAPLLLKIKFHTWRYITFAVKKSFQYLLHTI